MCGRHEVFEKFSLCNVRKVFLIFSPYVVLIRCSPYVVLIRSSFNVVC